MNHETATNKFNLTHSESVGGYSHIGRFYLRSLLNPYTVVHANLCEEEPSFLEIRTPKSTRIHGQIPIDKEDYREMLSVLNIPDPFGKYNLPTIIFVPPQETVVRVQRSLIPEEGNSFGHWRISRESSSTYDTSKLIRAGSVEEALSRENVSQLPVMMRQDVIYRINQHPSQRAS